jgi:type I restriction enzyme S subunit
MRKGWEMKTIGEVCKVIAGQSPEGKYYNDTGNGLPFYQGKKEYGEKYIGEPKIWTTKVTKEAEANDILISVRAPVGPINLSTQKICIGRGLAAIRASKFIQNEFLYYFLMKHENEIEGNTGAVFDSINKAQIEGIKIPLPPLSEQQEIVSILDNTFESIERAKSNAEQNLKNAKELFESYLKNIFNTNKSDWINSTIGETCNLQTGGTPSTSKKEYYVGGSIKWLVSGDINQKVIEDCEGRITEDGMKNSNTKYLPVNSVLIALNGQGKTRGTVAMLRTKATCNQSLVSIFPKNEKELLPDLVFSNLEGRYEEIRKMTGDSGNDRRGLNMPLIRSIKFSYPKSILTQKEVIKKLDLLRSEIKRLESLYQQKLNDLEELKKSILQKAFNGELKTSKISA